MSEELKPCPFCGSPAMADHKQDCFIGMTFRIINGESGFMEDAEFDRTWNTRHLTRAEVEKWCADNGLAVVDQSSTWPANDIVSELLRAAKILLTEKNYDGHGYETINSACDEAGLWLNNYNKAMLAAAKEGQ